MFRRMIMNKLKILIYLLRLMYWIILLVLVVLLLSRKSEYFAPTPDAPFDPDYTTVERPEKITSSWKVNNSLDALNYYNQTFSNDEFLPMEKMCDRKCQIISVLSRDCYSNKYDYCIAGNYDMTPNNRMGDSCSNSCTYAPGDSSSNCCLW